MNLHYITALHGSQLFVQDIEILMAPQYREALLSRLPILRTRVEGKKAGHRIPETPDAVE